MVVDKRQTKKVARAIGCASLEIGQGASTLTFPEPHEQRLIHVSGFETASKRPEERLFQERELPQPADKMEQDQQAQSRGSFPRLSRLPMPRASNDNLRALRPVASRDNIHQDALSRVPNFARPGNVYSSGSAQPSITSPLSETSHNSIRGRFGWEQSTRGRNRSPVRDALLQASATLLETTPPSSAAEPQIYEDSDENAIDVAAINDEKLAADVAPPVAAEKRRPRPSLSERTMETLSQISPSPSPTRRRRSSIFSNEGTMGPPSRPASSMKTSRPATSHGSRPSSPAKRPFRPPGASSPTKDIASVPSIPPPSSIYTPPKAFMRDRSSRIAKPTRETRRSISTALPESSHKASHMNAIAKPAAKTMRVKPNTSSTMLKISQPRPSLASIFHDPPKPKSTSTKTELPLPKSSHGLMKPRSPGENILAPSVPSSSVSANSASSTRSNKSSITDPEEDSTPARTSKSSVTLRETIAKAKAHAQQSKKASSVANVRPTSVEFDPIEEQVSFGGSNHGLMRKRIQGATTTGTLNIAAMKLKQLPDEVMHMYDFDPAGNTNWSEAVDVVKFIAADNQLTELREDAFPDWTIADLEQDESRSNQFGGLEVLDLHGNLLQSIPIGLRRLERLHTLNLSNNLLKADSLDIICQLAGLKELYMASNELKGALPPAIGNLKRLQVLDTRSNAIDELPDAISCLTQLRILRLSENKLTSIAFEKLAALPLIELTASKNNLRGSLIPVGVDQLATLKILDVSFNNLDSISSDPSFSFPALQSLTIDGNRIASLPDVSSLTSLSILTASENLLTELPEGFTELVDLRNADFSRNQIRLLPERLATMENLTSLNLASNPLRDRKYLTMTTAQLKDDLRKRFATGEVSNNDIDISGTQSGATASSNSASAPEYLHTPKSGTLDLSTHDLTSLDLSTIDLKSSITILKLSSTSLASLPVELLTHPSVNSTLTNLDLSHNPLSNTTYLTTPLTLPALTSLYIVSTGLTTLSSLLCNLTAPNLHTLNISCHRLTGPLPELRTHFPTLTTLLATDNWFTSLPLPAITGLEVLDIRNNEIEFLPPQIGMLANRNSNGKHEPNRLRVFEVGGNKFRVPSWRVVERGTDAVLKGLRRMVPLDELEEEWKGEF